MAELITGIGEFKISNTPGDIIKAYGIGSCIAIGMFCGYNKVAGMLHAALPDSSVSTEKSKNNPALFVDSGMEALIESLRKYGCVPSKMTVKITGGASMLDNNAKFNVGNKNIETVRGLFKKYNLNVVGQDVGGSIGRNVSFFVDTGKMLVVKIGLGKIEL